MSTQVTEQLVLDALRQINDPDLHKDIVTLGFIKDLKIDNGVVSFRIVLTTPACPVKAEMESAVRSVVRKEEVFYSTFSISSALFFEPKPMQLHSAMRTSAFLAVFGT